jgi:tetratricopeptide (TPR) repeat protein
LTVLHNDHVKQRFGENRCFIRCDQFPPSRVHLLGRLSKVAGAGIGNPEDLTPLRPFLSSKEMFVVLDNAESILDPQGADAQGIYAVVEELSQFSNICLCITSRITTLPSDCETLDIPTLSIEAARDTFHRIYKNIERSDLVSNILERLDFHPLSITLLATVAHHNKWDINRLTREWEMQRTRLLRTQHNRSLAATIELSLASPTFQALGHDARDLLGVVAFFPQGIDESNLEWLSSTISNGRDVFDKLCVLSLTYRSGGFITMLAPLRDHLHPEDPISSPLLHAIKECYFKRLSVFVNPGSPGYEEARWIMSEDVNVEHLLDVFTLIDANSDDVWDACANFMEHLCWHKQRLVVLGPKLEELPDKHPSKPRCLFELSRLFESVGNLSEYKRLLVCTLKLWREWGDDVQVAIVLNFLAHTNQRLLLFKEGIQQAEEALKINERLSRTADQAACLQQLASLLCEDKQLDAAEEAASRSIDLLLDTEQFKICQGHRVLGGVYYSKGEAEKAINHFETALGIASSSNWHTEQFFAHCSLAQLLGDQGRFDEAHAHVEFAKSHTVNDTHFLGRATRLQVRLWCRQGRLEEAKSGALCAVSMFENLGAATDVEDCRILLRDIEERMGKLITSGGSGLDGELPEPSLLPTPVNPPSSARGTE